MTPSELAWLDFSEAEQRLAREAVQLFAQCDSRDELGTGVLRDIISERLFPGISVLHQPCGLCALTCCPHIPVPLVAVFPQDQCG